MEKEESISEKANKKNNTEIIKVNISLNDSNKINRLNKVINENMLLDENNKIETNIPIPESKPIQLYQSAFKYNESEIISYTPISETKNSNNNSSLLTNAKISLLNSTNSKNSTNKINSIFNEMNSSKKYTFDLYKHIKENIKFKEKLCKDGLSKDSFYCINCKMSTCPKCPNFKSHKNHEIIRKYPYYECSQTFINDYFNDLDTIFSLNPNFLDVSKVKEELKEHVINHVTQLFNKLTEIKNTKIREIEHMFENTENTVETLKFKINKMKEDLNDFFEKEKKFFCYDLKANENYLQMNKEANEIILNLQEEKKSNTGLIKKNNDSINTGFLITYDLLKNIQNINQEIKYFLYDIKQNREKFLNEFTIKTKIAYEDLQKLLSAFDGHFNYQYLVLEFYQIIYDKISKYKEKIEKMKKNIFEKVNQTGNYDTIDKENKIFGTYLHHKFENILNNQLIDEDEAITMKSIIPKSKKSRKSSGYKKLPTVSTISFSRFSLAPRVETKSGEISENKLLYNIPEEIVLNKQVLQDNFTYEIFNTINENFRTKKKKIDEIEEEFDEEVDLAKPIPNKNEMHVYDRKNKTISKKIVKFDKKIHKYLYFLNGCRTVLIKDKLYIFGGVDKENNITKIAYVYYINTNELKPMPEMLKPHAYHSVQFLDYYKSIIIVGGENSTFCELYDLSTGLWRELPEMKTPRANTILYLDKITHIFYAFFGILGKIAEKNNNYTDVLECLEFKKLALGWNKIEYKNKAEMNFRIGINQIYQLNCDILLVYGGSTMRDFIKKAAIYLLNKQEMIKIDNKIFNDIREASKTSKKLYKILNSSD